MADQPRYVRAATKPAEKQMRQWALGLEVKQRVEHEHSLRDIPQQLHPFIAISRDTGAGASQVAQRVAEQLSWELLDKDVLDQMAKKFDLEKSMLQAVDETKISWMLELFGKWVSQRVVTNTEYTKRLGEILLMAAQHSSTVFVGRGAQFFLPRERGLTVQLVAPLPLRIERVMQRENWSRDKALKYLRKRDRERCDFVREHFNRDVADVHLYDLAINLERCDFDAAAELIVLMCRRRFGLS